MSINIPHELQGFYHHYYFIEFVFIIGVCMIYILSPEHQKDHDNRYVIRQKSSYPDVIYTPTSGGLISTILSFKFVSYEVYTI